MGKLCQQRLLLAGLVLLCLFLPMAIGAAAESALSEGVSFSGLKLAVTAPEDDPVPEQLEQVLSNMQDVKSYCAVEAMEPGEAIEALKQGEVMAVLQLPEAFVQGIMNGTNPDVELIVSAERPLEALLTLWVGQSASDLLAAVQSGIYTVLELYSENPPAGTDFQEAMMRINMRYISWTLNRQGIYRVQEIPVTDQLPLGVHYSLSLFAWLMLSLSPMFTIIYSRKWIASQRRFRAVGRGFTAFYGTSLLVGWMLYAVLLLVFQLVLGGNLFASLLAALLCGGFCSAFAALCCLLTEDGGGCGVLSFVISLVFLVLSGGVLPPVLMPEFLQKLIALSPISWLRSMLALSSAYELQPYAIPALALASILMVLPGGLLYAGRGNREAGKR